MTNCNVWKVTNGGLIVKVWNIVCKDICLDTVSIPNSFKCLVKRKYFSIVDSVYDVNLSCT